MTAAQLEAFINTWVDNDPVKAFQKFRMNTILNALLGLYNDAIAGTLQWGNIQGNIDDQLDLITKLLKVRNSVGALTGDGLEIVVNNGIYYNGDLIGSFGGGSGTAASNIAIRSSDFEADGVTCLNPDVLLIPGHSYQIMLNELNRFIYPDGAAEPGAGYVEWELTSEGGFKINLPGFDANTNDYHLYVFPFIAGATPPVDGDGIDIGGSSILLISNTDHLLIS